MPLISGVLGALKTGRNWLSFVSWGVELGAFRRVRNGTGLNRETGPDPPVELADLKARVGFNPGPGVRSRK